MNELYEFLKKMKLDINNANRTIHRMDSKKLFDLIIELHFKIVENNKDMNVNKESIFNFVANESLSGGAISCSNIECRLNRVNELSNFAALYGDKILIKNPFESIMDFPKNIELNHSSRNIFVVDIIILWKLKPLINKGIISFIQTEHHFCKDCFRKLTSTKSFNYEKRLKEAQRIVRKKIKNSIRSTYCK